MSGYAAEYVTFLLIDRPEIRPIDQDILRAIAEMHRESRFRGSLRELSALTGYTRRTCQIAMKWFVAEEILEVRTRLNKFGHPMGVEYRFAAIDRPFDFAFHTRNCAIAHPTPACAKTQPGTDSELQR